MQTEGCQDELSDWDESDVEDNNRKQKNLTSMAVRGVSSPIQTTKVSKAGFFG